MSDQFASRTHPLKGNIIVILSFCTLFFQFCTLTKPGLLKYNLWDSTGKPERMHVNKHCVFHCSKSKTIHGSTPVQIIIYLSVTKGLCTLITQIDYVL